VNNWVSEDKMHILQVPVATRAGLNSLDAETVSSNPA
jgi:hypothetical protein